MCVYGRTTRTNSAWFPIYCCASLRAKHDTDTVGKCVNALRQSSVRKSANYEDLPLALCPVQLLQTPCQPHSPVTLWSSSVLRDTFKVAPLSSLDRSNWLPSLLPFFSCVWKHRRLSMLPIHYTFASCRFLFNSCLVRGLALLNIANASDLCQSPIRIYFSLIVHVCILAEPYICFPVCLLFGVPSTFIRPLQVARSHQHPSWTANAPIDLSLEFSSRTHSRHSCFGLIHQLLE